MKVTLDTTSKELGESISYTQLALRNTTEEQSDETRGSVETTQELISSLNVEIHATQDCVDKVGDVVGV